MFRKGQEKIGVKTYNDHSEEARFSSNKIPIVYGNKS